MQDRYSVRRRRAVAAVALALAISASAGAAFAQEATEEDETVPLDTKILRQLMKDWGFRRDGDAVGGIDYRERAPLVLPPNRALPPPQSEATGSIKNPAWPVDPDVKRRKQEAAAEKAKLKGGVSVEEQSRALRPSELNQVRRAPGEGSDGSNGPAVGPTAEDSARPMSPSELGTKNPFGSLFSSFGPNKKAETAPFTGEPPRASMTEPPSGYQTPSPSQPYGVGAAKDTYTVPKPEDTAVGGAQGK
jgi:hypothetical protein